MEHISKAMESQFPRRSPREALDSYKHIELTEDETAEALLQAKIKKERILEQQALEQRAAENRKALTGQRWSYDQTKGFMIYRATEMFGTPFTLDHHNSFLFELLCHYFSESQQFVSMATNAGITAPSLSKGILLAGNFGVGKTWMMKLFQRNQRQVYQLVNAKLIADEFESDGEEAMKSYVMKPKLPVNDAKSFFHTHTGLCIDDLGTEDIKQHYGNKKNVIGDLLEKRYALGNTGVFLHGTTNLTAEQLKELYGGRVISRLREVFNFIELPGTDRRR